MSNFIINGKNKKRLDKNIFKFSNIFDRQFLNNQFEVESQLGYGVRND